jgi:ubiquitin C-terminal hydrolase
MEKSKLKGLFDQMDLGKKKQGQGIKTDEEKYKTKPTKPNFGNTNVIGITKQSTQYKGLINYGNICYSNVVMQCLNGLKEFVNLLKKVFAKVEDFDTIEEDYPILYNMVKLMSFYESKILN